MYFSPLTLCLLLSTSKVITAAPAKPENSDPDRSPGIGVEFEASGFVFSNEDCAMQDTFDSKGKEVNGRSGKDWALTVDTTESHQGKLTGEYILNGKSIKLGSGRAKEAAAELKEDLDKWKPWKANKDCPTIVDLLKPVNEKCETWSVIKPTSEIGFKFLMWQPQITAPMPLHAINELFQSVKESRKGPLLPEYPSQQSKMVWANKRFFQSAPECNEEDVGDDVLGFFSLVLSYAKSGNTALGKPEEKSIKAASSIMPRTDFLTIYNDVKSGIQGDLYELVRVLLCYKDSQEGDGVELDTTWCDGSPEAPEPKNKMDLMTYKIRGTNPHTKKAETVSFTLQDWMEGLNGKGEKLEEANKADGTTGAKDLMTYHDRWVDGQIGGLKGVKEHIYNNNKVQVPLFEFRDLGSLSSDNFQQEVEKAENEILKYHRKYHNGGASDGSG